jgi:hypothetical protein
MAAPLALIVMAGSPAREVPAPTPTVTIVASAATVAPAVVASLVPWYPAPSYAAPVPTLTPTPLPTPSTPTVAQARAWAMRTLGRTQYTCLSWIVQAESRWDPRAWNRKGSGAYGLAQAKPASRMAPYGADYMTNPITQLRFAIGYARERYGSPCEAWEFWARHGWW